MDAIAVYKGQIREFFEKYRRPDGADSYADEWRGREYKVQLLMDPPPKRLLVSINDVRKYSKDLATTLLQRALVLLPEFEAAAAEIAQAEVHVGFFGAFGREKHTPRTLNSSSLGKLLSIDGIVTSSSIVRPKIKRSVHYNAAAKSFVFKDYRDAAMVATLPPTSTVVPSRSLEGNRLDLEYGLSTYTDHQTVTLQEMPEFAPTGQLPRSVTLIFDDDLADRLKPGDRVRAFGTYKCVSHVTVFPDRLRTAVIVNNVQRIGEMELKAKPEDIEKFTRLSKHPSLLTEIAKSVAPSIYGHEHVKAAIALMLFGGNPVAIQGGGRIRGDINILMVGDPGVAKSQLLRYVLGTSPLAIGATGKGASGVGLTAAVVTDQETGERRIEAGAMVLADTGIVCIDEFDKMDDGERPILHEAMEQQTVTVAKGGVHVTLNARCAVLAAANPVTGQYRANLSPRENIRLPESLLTRFDLIFVMEDKTDFDAAISEHVLRKRCGKDHEDEPDSREQVPYMENGAVEQSFLKRYIHHCRQLSPRLSEAACKFIAEKYVEIRRDGEENRRRLTRGVTARVLETLIRLSTAHAKMRLSEEIEVGDAEVAVEMVTSSLFMSRRKQKRDEQEAEPGYEMLLEKLYAYREANPYDHFISLDAVVQMMSNKREETVQILRELESEKIVMLQDGLVIFTNETA